MATAHSMPAPESAMPPLQQGDRLTADEFFRRSAPLPKSTKAELIDGVVYLMTPPVSQEHHSNPHFNLIGLLGIYAAATPGVEGGDNGSLKLDDENVPQPDCFLRILPSHGGQSKTDEAGYVVGAVEFVAEIAASNVSYDLHDKLQVYRKHGVQEYLVWRVWDKAVDWFVLKDGKYESIPADDDGIYRSRVFPGLWLDTSALLQRDLSMLLTVGQKGTASEEHIAFVQAIADRKS